MPKAPTAFVGWSADSKERGLEDAPQLSAEEAIRVARQEEARQGDGDREKSGRAEVVGILEAGGCVGLSELVTALS